MDMSGSWTCQGHGHFTYLLGIFYQRQTGLCQVGGGLQAAYIRVPRIARRKVHEAGLPFRDGLHAASHAMLNVIPLFMLCGATDMGAECDNPYDTRYRPERLLVYDKHPGGIGLAAQVGTKCTPKMKAESIHSMFFEDIRGFSACLVWWCTLYGTG